jgi:hypothetical protein
MLLASSTGKDGRKLLIVGLQQENITRLLDDMPIRKSLDIVSGLEDWDLFVLGPEDLVRFAAQVAEEDAAEIEGNG